MLIIEYSVLYPSESEKKGLDEAGLEGDRVASCVQCVLPQRLLCPARDTATIG